MAEPVAERERAGWWHAYRTVLGSRVRAKTAYRVSFTLDVIGSALVSGADLGEIYVIFHNVDALGGLGLRQALLVFGLAELGFAIGNAVAGQLDQMPVYIRTGTLDVLMLRPAPVLAQVLTGDVALKRLGAAGVAGAVLAVALAVNDITWTPQRLALLALTPPCAAAVFSALFLVAGAVQFWLVDASELTNSFTYGSSYAAVYSSGVLPLPLRLFFAFVVPAAFTAYLPALVILDLPGPAGLPAWLGWGTPLVAVLAWCGALAAWRAGLRHYTGAGG